MSKNMLQDDFKEFMNELHAENFELSGGVAEVYHRNTEIRNEPLVDSEKPLEEMLDSIPVPDDVPTIDEKQQEEVL